MRHYLLWTTLSIAFCLAACGDNATRGNNGGGPTGPLTFTESTTPDEYVTLLERGGVAGPRVLVLDLDEKSVIYETPSGFGGVSAFVSEDGTRLALRGQNDDRSLEGIFTVALPDGELEQLPLPWSDPAFLRIQMVGMSADGSRILYWCSATTQEDGPKEGFCLWEGGSSRFLEASSDIANAGWVLSADGSTAVGVTGDQLYRFDLDTGEKSVLYDYTNPPSDDYPTETNVWKAAVSADGSVVAVSGLRDERRSIAILRDGQPVEALTYPATLHGRGSGFDLSRDGSMIAFNARGELHVKTVGSDDAVVAGALFGEPSWTASGAGVLSHWTDPDDFSQYQIRYTPTGSNTQDVILRATEGGLEDNLGTILRAPGSS
jgi:hypothetical protein